MVAVESEKENIGYGWKDRQSQNSITPSSLKWWNKKVYTLKGPIHFIHNFQNKL